MRQHAGPSPHRPADGLAVEKVTVRYGGNAAVSSVSCSTPPGDVLAVIGPNGAGKSTLLRTVAGLQRAQEGRVLIGGRDVTAMDFRQRSRNGLALTFQIPRSAPSLTVEEQLAAQVHGLHHVRGPRSRAAMGRVAEIVARMELGSVTRRRTSELTFGEVRRFEIARALVSDPTVLLVDEPSSGMSSDDARHLAQVLASLAAGAVTVLLVEHNIPFVRALAQRTVVLDAGRVLIGGPTEEVLAAPEVKEAYLGRATA